MVEYPSPYMGADFSLSSIASRGGKAFDRPARTGTFLRFMRAKFILYFSCSAKAWWKLSLFKSDLLQRRQFWSLLTGRRSSWRSFGFLAQCAQARLCVSWSARTLLWIRWPVLIGFWAVPVCSWHLCRTRSRRASLAAFGCRARFVAGELFLCMRWSSACF